MANNTIVPVLDEEAKRQTTRVKYHVPAFTHYQPSEELRAMVQRAGPKQFPHLTELMRMNKQGLSKFAWPAQKPTEPPPEGHTWVEDAAITVLGKRKASDAEISSPPALQATDGTKKIVRRRRAKVSLFVKPKHMGLHEDNNNCMAGKRPAGFSQLTGPRAEESGAVVHNDTIRVRGADGAMKVLKKEFQYSTA
ncbi:hypothetical protein DV735_g903, partial [Chaetothyriales sp. CBS 134920]